jgi:hypothetical protein
MIVRSATLRPFDADGATRDRRSHARGRGREIGYGTAPRRRGPPTVARIFSRGSGKISDRVRTIAAHRAQRRRERLRARLAVVHFERSGSTIASRTHVEQLLVAILFLWFGGVIVWAMGTLVHETFYRFRQH